MSPKFPAISVREITRVLKKMIFFGGTEWKSSKMERAQWVASDCTSAWYQDCSNRYPQKHH